jgi:hypothetical protein
LTALKPLAIYEPWAQHKTASSIQGVFIALCVFKNFVLTAYVIQH